jgi:hypothetical protein
MLKCITETEGVQILREVHIGTCGSHAGSRALAAKVICQGFYWPAMICAANRVVRSCEACQKFSPRSGRPSQFTKLIAHTWPLQRWGLDIVRPLPTAQGNLKFTFVVVEYFTKWIEARAVFTITSKTAQKFFWQNIVCRFGVSSELMVDNGKQFDNQDFKDFCFSIGTKLAFASVYHPQSNGVVERANGKIFIAIKKMLLDNKKGKWPDLLPEVVWALNKTECRATGFTPFRLLYGSEAMTPQEIKHGTSSTETASSPYRLWTNTKPRQKHGATTQSSRGSSTKETSCSSGQLGQSPGASWSRSGRALSSSRRRRPPVRTDSQLHPTKT